MTLLSGGTISRASGISEVFGNLDLTTGVVPRPWAGATGTLAFGTYVPRALLTVQNSGQGNVLICWSDLTNAINKSGLFSFHNCFTSDWNAGTRAFTITASPNPPPALRRSGCSALCSGRPVASCSLMQSPSSASVVRAATACAVRSGPESACLGSRRQEAICARSPTGYVSQLHTRSQKGFLSDAINIIF